AKIIFLSGGDQSVLMKHISGTEFKKKIQKAFWNGSTIAGTSAGAALMSEKMITGNALLDTTYESTFYLLLENNVEITEGLGLLDSVIIDQHFVVRSRYNRLLSALHAFPNYQCIGIDEETALVVHKGRGKVIGNSQVIVVSNTEAASDKNSIINTKNIDLDIYAPGEEMEVK
ncbi:MAG: cyanophycinase, partial [Chitinophagales bacterium]